MVIVRLAGGIGNQMFMYATAKALALRTGQDLLLDTYTGFKYDVLYKRNYQLNYFHIPELEAPRILSFNYIFGRYIRGISRYVKKNIFSPKYEMIREINKYNVDQRLFFNVQNVYLEGYWQNEVYFKEFENDIRSIFRFDNVKIYSNIIKEEEMLIRKAGSRSVCIGIRRYQECNKPSSFGLCDVDYYHKAIDIIRCKIESPVFFIFSQDMDWVKNNIKIDNNDVYFISRKIGDKSAIDDLYLMTQCSHFIISNSTYYWWGAWLGCYKDKSVICPSNDKFVNLTCNDWIKIIIK